MVRVDDPSTYLSTNMDARESLHCGMPTKLETPPTSSESSAFDWDPDSITAARQSRSQSLTDARTMAVHTRPQLLEVPSPTCVVSASTDNDAARNIGYRMGETAHDALLSQRRLRRAMSAEMHGSSLSLLQQELGYPKPHKASPVGHDGKATPTGSRRRRGSRRSQHSASSNGDVSKDEPHDRPAATSDAPTLADSDYEEDPEAEAEADEEEEENFLDNRLASVTGYARDTDGIVYYEIVVESTAHGPLSAYKVRRRYSEFRDLHRALAKVMPTHKPKHHEHQHQRQHHNQPRMSVGGMSDLAYLRDTDTNSSASARGLSRSLYDGSPRPLRSSACWLPPLPDTGGLWSILQSESPRFLETRARAFHAIILAAQQHPHARASRLLNQFLGPPPDSFASNTYVSLNRFAAPTLRFSIEIQERKEMAQTISRKRRQLDPHHATLSPPHTAAAVAHPPSIAE